MLKGRAFGQRTCFDQGAPNLRVSRRNGVFSRLNKPPLNKKTVPAEPASARAPTMGSVGPFELAPAPDLERLMPLLPSLKKRPRTYLYRKGVRDHTSPVQCVGCVPD